MKSQLHETTLKLISLIHFYKWLRSDNEKIRRAIDFSQSLITQGIKASSEETKLQFCSDAVEAITSVFIVSNMKNIKVKSVDTLLDREEIDFIHSLTCTDVRHSVEYKSDKTDNKNQGKLHGT